MAPSAFKYFGLNRSSDPLKESSKPARLTPVRALPSVWYTSQEMYELERRAIFSRRWILMTHKSRVSKAGDFLRYNMAGYDFIIACDRSLNIHAFHNVCRHRAYPVVEKQEGNAKIFACRYHGWSYGLNGKLAKAPLYDELDGFDKNQNGLYPIHVHIDKNGFVYVNMDSKETPEVAWEEHFANVDVQERYDQFNFDDYILDHTYQLDGNYNWKIAADNFNECYHCPTTHPDVPAFLNVESADVETRLGHMLHDHASTPEQRAKGFNVNSTYYFPNVSTSISPHFLMIQKFLPYGPGKSVMSYEVFRNKNSSDEDFKLISEMYARVMGEDKVLCDRAQNNLNAGVFINGELHPRTEKGPLFFQNNVRDVITEHYNREEAARMEIWPARQKLPENASASVADLEICTGLACRPKEGLAW